MMDPKDTPKPAESQLANTEFKCAMAAGACLVSATAAGGSNLAVIPDGYRIENLEQYSIEPRRMQSVAMLDNLEDFCAYVNQFKTATTRIFLSNQEALCILDYHESVQFPRWGNAKAKFLMTQSQELALWKTVVDCPVRQKTFCEFVEDNIRDMIDGEKLLSAILCIEAQKSIEFKSAVRLDNGDTSYSFASNTKKGEVEIPSAFTLWIPLFEGTDRQILRVSMRHDIDEKGQLSFRLRIPGLNIAAKDALDNIKSYIVRATELPVWQGRP